MSKHFLIQRRKTIHDITDFEQLNNTSPLPPNTTTTTTINTTPSQNLNNDKLFSSLVLSINNLN